MFANLLSRMLIASMILQLFSGLQYALNALFNFQVLLMELSSNNAHRELFQGAR